MRNRQLRFYLIHSHLGSLLGRAKFKKSEILVIVDLTSNNRIALFLGLRKKDMETNGYYRQKKQGRIHGRRCVRLCSLVNSGRACVCARVRACVCFAIPRHCGSANSLILAARLSVCMCMCMCVSVSVCVYMRVSALHFVSIVQV